MLPASATRPDAFISGLLDSTWPLLIPIEMVAPPPHAVFSEAICTFHAPSNVAAATGVAANIPRSTRMRLASNLLRCRSLCKLHCLCCRYGIRQGNGGSLFAGGAVGRQRRSVLSCRALFGGRRAPEVRCRSVSVVLTCR